MALIEAMTTKGISEKLLHRSLYGLVGSIVTLWLGFSILAHVTDPAAIIMRVGDYLGINGTDRRLAPISAWVSEPRHHALFVGAAVVAGVLFNIGAARILAIHSSAPPLAWVFFLPAVQGLGFQDAALICLEVTGAILGLALISGGDRHERQRVLSTFWRNLLENLFLITFPLALLLLWSVAAYNGERPTARNSSENPKQTGRTPLPPGPLR
ncbi:hypothetical protein [Amycolatopsis sp. VC5-11]|uniref:hypothetical protein n=1 Tax=Amycolatopsis sp. VC5-11 TaxID=3120156 RepID=UPI00300A6187